jgi:periplasmic protein TonB
MIGMQTSSRWDMLDDARKRLPIVALTTLVVWLGLLAGFGFLLDRSPVPPPDQSSIEAQLMDLPPEGLAAGEGGASAGTSKKSTQPVAKTKSRRVERHLTSLSPGLALPDPTRRHKFELTNAPAPPHRVAQVRQSVLPASPALPTKPTPASANSSASLSNQRAPAGIGVTHAAGSASGNAIASGSGASTGDTFGTGGSGPRAIYAPVPSIPDDMRDEVMQATAVVRFHVERDGKATVALITPTEFSGLDQLILETLRKWRFHPALKNGTAIDSEAEVRLLITVQ